jgi:UDP-3-O-[3-hydroxymyristoyl] glucosamine N-acyltransferase
MRSPNREMTLAQVAELIGARLVGSGEAAVRGVGTLSEAGPDEVTFLSNPRYRKALNGTRAAAVIAAEAVPGAAVPQLIVANPYAAYARLMRTLFAAERKAAGISPDARVDPSATVGPEPDIGPFVTVGPGCVIGARATLSPGVHVGAGCSVGDDVTLHAGVVLREGCRLGNRVTIHPGAVIGSDGFGYASEGGIHHKIPHVGCVVLEDDVELGANVTIDRAVLGQTVIGAGTKIDNQVQVAHNVHIGKGCLIAALAGISGSTELGDYVVMGGQSGIAGHVHVGKGTRVAAKAGVTKDTAAGHTVSGFPAAPHREELRRQAALARLPELRARVAALEKMVGAGAVNTKTTVAKEGEPG